ncbi:GNAT family N-acetyltransferase [Cryptosporangium japonicum]|uniref:N-acetyltransferase domain-containing protein n=1 Tax=Cryptosporangium japonicum TaxID=80872 RepID=A0ABP3DBE1_9ACTN
MTTASGDRVLVRRATASDLTAVNDLHERCSTRTLCRRYHGGRDRLRAGEWRRMVDPAAGRALVLAASDHPGRLIGYATLLRSAPGGMAEVSLLLQDDWQRRGIGSAMARHLVDAARRARLPGLVAWTEAGNLGAVTILRASDAQPERTGHGETRWTLGFREPRQTTAARTRSRKSRRSRPTTVMPRSVPS